MSKVKKVRKINLDDTLKSEIEGKINSADVESGYRKSSMLIKLDDLDPAVVNKINSWGAPAGSSYDDTELRNRIIKVEAGKADTTIVFDKTIDKVGKSLLDSVLGPLIDKLTVDDADHENRIKAVELIVPNKKDVRYINVKITELDLDPDLKEKLDKAVSFAQTTLPSGGSSGVDLTNLTMDVNNLKATKAEKTDLANYRLTSGKIVESDLDSNLQIIIDDAKATTANQANKADVSMLASYRNKTTAIAESDLETVLQTKIEAGYNNAANTTAYVDSAVISAANNIKSEIVGAELGDKYDRDIFPLVLQRKVVAFYSITDDKYTFIHLIGWLSQNYRANDVLITNTDLDATLQSDIANAKANVSTIQGDVSALKTAVNSITFDSAVANLQTTITAIESKLSTMQSDLTSLTARVATLESKP